MINVILSFALGFIIGGFLTLIIVLIFDKFHRHNYQAISEQYVYERVKEKCYTLITTKCIVCGKVKTFKIKH